MLRVTNDGSNDGFQSQDIIRTNDDIIYWRNDSWLELDELTKSSQIHALTNNDPHMKLNVIIL